MGDTVDRLHALIHIIRLAHPLDNNIRWLCEELEKRLGPVEEIKEPKRRKYFREYRRRQRAKAGSAV